MSQKNDLKKKSLSVREKQTSVEEEAVWSIQIFPEIAFLNSIPFFLS